MCGKFCFGGHKGRLWVPFRLLVVGARIRILIPIGWKKLFYKHLSLPFCPNLFFYYQMRSMSTKYQSNAFGSHTRSVSSQSLLRYILAMTLTPVTARVLAVARKSAPELAGTTTKTRRQLDGANEHQPGQFARLCLVNPNSTLGCTDKHLRSSPSKRPPLQALLCSIVHFALWQLKKHMVSCRCTQRNISTAVV